MRTKLLAATLLFVLKYANGETPLDLTALRHAAEGITEERGSKRAQPHFRLLSKIEENPILSEENFKVILDFQLLLRVSYRATEGEQHKYRQHVETVQRWLVDAITQDPDYLSEIETRIDAMVEKVETSPEGNTMNEWSREMSGLFHFLEHLDDPRGVPLIAKYLYEQKGAIGRQRLFPDYSHVHYNSAFSYALDTLREKEISSIPLEPRGSYKTDEVIWYEPDGESYGVEAQDRITAWWDSVLAGETTFRIGDDPQEYGYSESGEFISLTPPAHQTQDSEIKQKTQTSKPRTLWWLAAIAALVVIALITARKKLAS